MGLSDDIGKGKGETSGSLYIVGEVEFSKMTSLQKIIPNGRLYVTNGRAADFGMIQKVRCGGPGKSQAGTAGRT